MPGTQERQITATDLRVVLLADAPALRCYGPVLRRMAVGLFDEVSDLSLLSVGDSPLLEHVPSPPIRLIIEHRGYSHSVPRVDVLSRQITINAPRLELVDHVLPQRQVNRITQTLSPYKPTLLHALSERQADLARRLSKAMRIPYVVSLLSMYDTHVTFSRNRCGGVLCCNSAMAKFDREREPALSSRVHLLPIGTHVTDSPCCFTGEVATARMFCHCPLRSGHGLSELINAVRHLTKKGHSLHLMISGEGPAEHELRQQVNRCELVKHIHFVPPVEKMVPGSDCFKTILQNMDIFVQPWPAKMWQPALLEAMSVGNAIVAVDAKNNDLIIDGKTALAVPFQATDSLVAALEQIISNHELAQQLGGNAQAYLRKHFLASKMIARLAHVYHECLAERGLVA